MPGPNNNHPSEESGETPATIAHYRILRRLGKGGMGEVFLGEDTRQHGRKVALKVLPPELTKDESRLRRFKQEARAILAVNHPNILTIFEIGQTDSTFYIATEFVDGETLRQFLWHDPIKIDEALGIAIQIAMALEAAHAAGIVHRDVKPENIMLRHDRFVRDRFVKVLDFGLAKLTEPDAPAHDPEAITMALSHTNPGAVIGTTGYMSPEQAQGEPIDARSDIFSLGVVLYEMLAGCAPFTGRTDSHVRVSIIDHEPAPLAKHSAEVPRHLERIVFKALSKDKAKRYQTIADLKLDLEQLREELHFSESEIRNQTVADNRSQAARQTGFIPSRADSNSSTDTRPVNATPTVSSMEYPVTRAGRNKTALFTILAVVVLAIIGIFYFNTPHHAIDSVAVLPFVNDSNDPNAELLV